MPTITRPYETLIRHHQDGSIGAHHVQIREIFEDGETVAVASRVMDPVPLNLVDDGTAQLLADVLGDTANLALASAEAATQAKLATEQAAAATISQIRAEAEALVTEAQSERDAIRSQAEQDIAVATGQVTELTNQLATLQADFETRGAHLQQALARIAELETQPVAE